MSKFNNDLFYTCSLIEFIGRQQNQKRSAVVKELGDEGIRRIYQYSSVFHCEPIEKVAHEFIEIYYIPKSNFDNVKDCQYDVPDYWTIGEVYERLIEDVAENRHQDVADLISEIFQSWIDDAISNYNSDFYYQSRDYIFQCYLAGNVLE